MMAKLVVQNCRDLRAVWRGDYVVGTTVYVHLVLIPAPGVAYKPTVLMHR